MVSFGTMSARLSIAALLLLAAACSHKEAPAPPQTDDPALKPVDRLAPNELSEGKEKAFALVLPKQVKISSAFNDIVVVQGEVPAEALANYVRGRVKDGKSVVGVSQTLFEGVHVPAEPNRPLDIRIERLGGGHYTRMIVRDVTPAPPLTGDPASRMKAVGLTPDGKLADPKHLQ